MLDRARPDMGGDVVINSVGYTLWRDPSQPEAGLAWKAVGGTDLLDGAPDRPATEEWPFGWAGGMGETIKIGDSAGYAYSVGWDAHKPGVMRLPSTRTVLTSTKPPADYFTHFWSDKPAGAAVFSTGNFVAGAATFTHGLSVTPKAVIFMVTGHATAADGTIQSGVSFGMGWCDGDANNGGVSYYSANGVGTTDTERSYSSTDSILITDGAGAYHVQGKVTALGTSTCTLSWTQSGDSNEIVQFWAIGGNDVSASVDEMSLDVGTTNPQFLTASTIGFSPQAALCLSANTVASGIYNSGIFSFGVGDNVGNMSTALIDGEIDLSSPSSTNATSYFSALNGIGGMDGAGALAWLSVVSANPAGVYFKVNNSVTSATRQVSVLSLRGLQARVNNTAITTTVSNTQDAESIGFTTESFLVFGQRLETAETLTANASFGMGLVAGTSSVESFSMHDEDAVVLGTTDTDSVFDTTAAMSLLSDAAIIDEATCGDIDMENAGWLTWGTESGNPYLLGYLAMAALGTGEDTTYVYCGNGDTITKMSVSSDLLTITEEQSRSKAGGTFGKPAKFDSVWHIPWGGSVTAEYISTIGAGVDDTYANINGTPTALAFTTQMDGATSKILRAYSTNLVDASATGGASASFDASAFEVGDDSAVITNMEDSGTSVFVGKADGLYWFEQPGIAFPLTHIPRHSHGANTTHGVGLLAVHGTNAAIYNHGSQLFWFDGANLPDNIAPESSLLNSLIDNLTHVPLGGEWMETAQAGNWHYALYRVTETTDVTYLMAFYRAGGRWVFHSYNRIDGIMRGLGVIDIDGVQTLWTTFLSEGYIGFYVIGRDGSPYAARDSIGYGEASTTYLWYGPEVSHDAPITNKQLWRMVIHTRDISSTCPIQLQLIREDGSAQNVGSTITADGQAIRYLTLGTNDTAVRHRPVISMTTTAGYAPTTTDPQVLALADQVYPRPDRSRTFQIIVDTQLRPLGDSYSIDDAKTVRDRLVALTGDAAPVACTDPDGNSIQLKFTEIRELALRTVSNVDNKTVNPDENTDFSLHWTIECTAIERKSA